MIDPGAPTTRGTDWLSLDVPQIWGMLADHETETHQRVVSGWRKAAELSQLHLHRLQAYRRELAAAWSPTGSAAAREYIDRLDYLIDTIQQAHDTASANYTTFSGATSAIAQGRRDLQQIYDDYTAKAQIRLDYDRLMQERKAMGGGEIVNSTPPVSDQELQQLRGRARLVMYGLSSELRQAQVELRMPPRYHGEAELEPGNGAGDFGSGSSPLPPLAGAVAVGTGTASAPSAGPPTLPPTTNPSSTGPVLGSAGPIVSAPATPPAVPPAIVPSTPSLGGAVPPVLAPGGTGIPGGRPPSLPYGRHPAVPGLPRSEVPRAGTPGGGRGINSGGVIGGNHMAGKSDSPIRPNRPNPVGGLIGGTAAAATPAGRGPTRGPIPISHSAAVRPMAAGGASIRRQNSEEPRQWDPDHPWETDQGVEPILLPPPPPGRIDPGPAIGYIR